MAGRSDRPKVYALCGSTRFPEAFSLVDMHLSLLGYTFLSASLFSHADIPVAARFLTDDGVSSNAALERLHFRKMDMADAVFVVNVSGHVGEAAKREIAYAEKQEKPGEWLFDPVPEDSGVTPVAADEGF